MENIEVVNTDLTWIDVYFQNKDAQRKLKEYDQVLVEHLKEEKDILAVVDRETISNMNSELNENINVARDRILYEFNAYSEDDIRQSKLTKREQLVLKHKMTINRFIEIDKILGLAPSSSYIAYESAIKKIKNYRKKNSKEKELNLLSEQQIQIMKYREDGYSEEEIAIFLNTSNEVIATQLWRINKILNPQNEQQKSKKLSKQQEEILRLLRKGLSNKEIAIELNVDTSVIKTQKSRIKKLGYFEKGKQK